MDVKLKPTAHIMREQRFGIALRGIILALINGAATIAIILWLLYEVPAASSKGWWSAVIILNMAGVMGIIVWSTWKQRHLLHKAARGLR